MATQCEKILDLLEERGEQGISNFELNDVCFRYGARLYDLKKQGYKITSKHIKGAKWVFRLEPSQASMF